MGFIKTVAIGALCGGAVGVLLANRNIGKLNGPAAQYQVTYMVNCAQVGAACGALYGSAVVLAEKIGRVAIGSLLCATGCLVVAAPVCANVFLMSCSESGAAGTDAMSAIGICCVAPIIIGGLAGALITKFGDAASQALTYART